MRPSPAGLASEPAIHNARGQCSIGKPRPPTQEDPIVAVASHLRQRVGIRRAVVQHEEPSDGKKTWTRPREEDMAIINMGLNSGIKWDQPLL